jgi:hypothetical protein
MTHDELLASIDKMINHDAIFMKDALRAVVELHRPFNGSLGLSCWECTNSQDLPWPCHTIQAIEKELE